MKIRTTTTLTGKGQITIPAYVRRLARLELGDKFVVKVIDADTLQAFRIETGKGPN